MAAVNGLEGIVAAETDISLVDGEHGQLVYRGYNASELAVTTTFEEVAHLLWYGRWPNEKELMNLKERFIHYRFLPSRVVDLMDQLDSRLDLMSVLRTVVSAMGVNMEWPPSVDQAIRFTSVLPTMIAYRYAKLQGQSPVEPNPQLSHVENYLYMLQGGTIPSMAQTRALETYFILTAEHGLNASTFTARVVTSTQSDLVSALTAAIGAMKGPLHGGAPSEVLDMLNEISDVSQAEPWLRNEIQSGRRIMGFGHRVYKTQDPRAFSLRKVANELAGHDKWLDLARVVEDAALQLLTEYKPGRRLYTNVEYWASAVFRACQIPKTLFTPTFSASRMAGWTAHVLEQAANNRLIRPLSRYTGLVPDNPKSSIQSAEGTSSSTVHLELAEPAMNLKDRVKSQFGRTAASYVKSLVHAQGTDLKTLTDWLSPKPSWSVLDVATGGGHVVKTLSPLVDSVVASDLTANMLAAARTYLDQTRCTNVNYVIADAESLPFLANTFDVVTCRIAAHHFPHPERFISEAFRVLRSGGKLLLIDNIVPEDKQLADFQNSLEAMRDPSHAACLSFQQWVNLLEAAGFELKRQTMFDKVLNFSDWLYRMVTSPEQATQVEDFIKGASPEAKSYFHIVENNEKIDSWSENTLILLAEK